MPLGGQRWFNTGDLGFLEYCAWLDHNDDLPRTFGAMADFVTTTFPLSLGIAHPMERYRRLIVEGDAHCPSKSALISRSNRIHLAPHTTEVPAEPSIQARLLIVDGIGTVAICAAATLETHLLPYRNGFSREVGRVGSQIARSARMRWSTAHNA
jgi:hypothetical protein